MSLLSKCKRFFTRPHLWLIRLISVIIPRRLRAGWRREWEAKLNYRESLLAGWLGALPVDARAESGFAFGLGFGFRFL